MSNDVKKLVNEAYNEVMPIILAKYPEFNDKFRIEYSNRLRTSGGVAYKNAFKIKLNTRLLSENLCDVKQTIVHEIAHLVEFHLGLRGGHGKDWQRIMSWLGYPAKTYHTMDTKKFKAKRKRFLFTCDCGENFKVTRKWYNSIMRGSCGCTKCGEKLAINKHFKKIIIL